MFDLKEKQITLEDFKLEEIVADLRTNVVSQVTLLKDKNVVQIFIFDVVKFNSMGEKTGLLKQILKVYHRLVDIRTDVSTHGRHYIPDLVDDKIQTEYKYLVVQFLNGKIDMLGESSLFNTLEEVYEYLCEYFGISASIQEMTDRILAGEELQEVLK